MIETERLTLRRWRDEDRDPYAAMMADPRVSDWLGGATNAAESAAAIERIEAHFERHGYGRFALERRTDGVLIGYVGLARMPDAYASTPVAGGVDFSWRLARSAWGSGYATEAARAVLDDGFRRVGLTEIVAFTAETNARSEAVMRRLGMRREAARDFDHPALSADHPLRRHIVYAISKD